MGLKDEPKEYVELYSMVWADGWGCLSWRVGTFEENSFEPYSNYQVGWQNMERWSIAMKKDMD